MVDWTDFNELKRDSAALERVIFCFLGVTLWELFSTCDFEWSLLTRRRKFRWPLVPEVDDRYSNALQVFFFLSRYCIILAFIGLIVSISVTSRINCGALYIFNSWAGNMTLLCSSTSLMLRTIALWERKIIVVVPLGVLCLAFWAILYRTMFIVHSVWDDDTEACVVASTNASLLNVTFFFTMGFDFIILIYTFVALTAKHTARTDLWRLLFHDGLVYFLVTFSANCVPAVLNVLNLNTIMNVIATIPAAAVSSIASGRAVMRLLDYTSADVYVHSVSGAIGAASSASPPRQILVTTEHITMSEFPCSSDTHSRHGKTHTSIDLGEMDHKDYIKDEHARESSEFHSPV